MHLSQDSDMDGLETPQFFVDIVDSASFASCVDLFVILHLIGVISDV